MCSGKSISFIQQNGLMWIYSFSASANSPFEVSSCGDYETQGYDYFVWRPEIRIDLSALLPGDKLAFSRVTPLQVMCAAAQVSNQ